MQWFDILNYFFMKWRIIYYENSQGKSPIYEFIENLSVKVQAKIANTLDLFEQYGVAIGQPHVKKLTGYPLWELRVLGTNNIRIFYVTKKEQTFLLLHGFIKKKKKTDKREIRVALERLEEYNSRHK